MQAKATSHMIQEREDVCSAFIHCCDTFRIVRWFAALVTLHPSIRVLDPGSLNVAYLLTAKIAAKTYPASCACGTCNLSSDPPIRRDRFEKHQA